MAHSMSLDEAREVLGLEPGGDLDEIQAAFQQAARLSYPNAQAKLKGDEAQFERARNAYEVLLDDYRRFEAEQAEVPDTTPPGASSSKLWQDLQADLLPAKAIRSSARPKWGWPSEIRPPGPGATSPSLSVLYDGASSWFDPQRPTATPRQTLFERSAYPSNAKHFCLLTIDSHDLFYRFPIDAQTSRRSAFVAPSGKVFEWLVLYKGLPGAAGRAEAALQALLHDVDCKVAGMEVVIYTCGGELHHIDTVNEALGTLRSKGLELKPNRGLLGAKFPELFRVCGSPQWLITGSVGLYPEQDKRAAEGLDGASADDPGGKELPARVSSAPQSSAAEAGPAAASAPGTGGRRRTNNKKNKGHGRHHKQDQPGMQHQDDASLPPNHPSRRTQKQVKDLRRYHNQQNRSLKKQLPPGDPWAAPADGPYLVMVCIIALSGFLIFVVLLAVFRILFGV